MIRVGIDFDNTIACYDKVFRLAAHDLQLPFKVKKYNKQELKKQILLTKNGNNNWMRLQGLVYGKYMHKASIFPGIMQFFLLAEINQIKIFIVSHKTIYGHYDKNKILLRDQAKSWIKKMKIPVKEEDIYFESTREKKIDRIKHLKCSYFIDDLHEIFQNHKFPNDIKKIHFTTEGLPSLSSDLCNYQNFFSWWDISNFFFGELNIDNIVHCINKYCPSLSISSAFEIPGRANSKVFKITSTNDKPYFLKIYPNRHYDSKKRLDIEYQASMFLYLKGYNVPKPVRKIPILNCGIYEWVNGSENKKISKKFFLDTYNFLSNLIKDSKSISRKSTFRNATEACFSGCTIEKQILKRFNKLSEVKNHALENFLQVEYIHVFNLALTRAKKGLKDKFSYNLPSQYRILSPSDFGIHNSLSSEGKTVFFDFEYFGWDDPVKFISDFYWHPAINLSKKNKEYWINYSSDLFADDKFFELRLRYYLSLFGLKWCMIVLNNFLPEYKNNYTYEQNEMLIDFRSNQLKKAKSILNNVEEMLIDQD